MNMVAADGHGNRRFHLVGHDWGGSIAWEIAGRYPHRLASLTLIFNSCGVGMGCKSLIFQGSRAGFLKNVVPRRGVLWLIILTYDEIMC
jgi:pimeloyl-ACP methyl ester carboxylesterase